MSTTVTLKNFVSLYANEAMSKTNYSKKSAMALRQTSNTDCYIYTKPTLPGPKGANYSDGKFRIFATAAIPSRLYRLRLLTKRFDPAKMTWSSGRPTDTATGQVDVTGAVSKFGFIEFDITSLLATAALMPEFFGFMIYLPNTDATPRYFYNQRGPAAYVPSMTVTYNTAPKKPSSLNPSGGRAVSVSHPTLSADFVDQAGNTELAGVKIEISANSNMSAPEFTYDTTTDPNALLVPEVRLADTSYAGVPSGATRYWRIAFKDGDGNWSAWSDTVSFKRTVKPVGTIVSPGAAPNDFVEETTPPIITSYTGTQKNIQVLLWNDTMDEVLGDTNKITTTETSINLPGAPLEDDKWYRVEVRWWDAEERAATPGDPAYSSAIRRFQYRLTNTVPPVTGLTVAGISSSPWAALGFTTSSPPDAFDFFRDGKAFAVNVPVEDVFVSSGVYRFVDRMAPPHTFSKWEVRAKTNGKTSSNNSTVNAKIKPVTAYLAALDGSFLIPFLNYSQDITGTDGSTVINIANSDSPITVYQGVYARQGTFEGVLSGELKGILGTETARDHRNNLLKLRDIGMQGKPCVLTFADSMIGCVVSQILDPVPIVKTEEILYKCEFYVAEEKGLLQ